MVMDENYRASVAAARLSMVYFLAAPKEAHRPARINGDPKGCPTAFRWAFVRYMADAVNRPRDFLITACRRTKKCSGNPPDCWRGLPPVPEEVIQHATAVMYRTLQQAGGRAEEGPGSASL
jgi:hypothetical protein